MPFLGVFLELATDLKQQLRLPDPGSRAGCSRVRVLSTTFDRYSKRSDPFCPAQTSCSCRFLQAKTSTRLLTNSWPQSCEQYGSHPVALAAGFHAQDRGRHDFEAERGSLLPLPVPWRPMNARFQAGPGRRVDVIALSGSQVLGACSVRPDPATS